jgi:hypothetical protein
VQDQINPLGMEDACDLRTDAMGRAGDEAHLSGEGLRDGCHVEPAYVMMEL